MNKLNEALKKAERIVFLTGAGVSVPSGIPDYRSKNGLYAGMSSPEYMLSHTCLVREPEKFYQFVTENMYYPDAEPNAIHTKMAEIEAEKDVTIITQNIDGLHEKAGSKKVVNFHGSLYHCYCQKCGMSVTAEEYLKSDIHSGCGGVIRPDVVLYEEAISESAIDQSLAAIRQADLIVIVGTSFRVSPFCNLTDYRNKKARIFAVNKERISLPYPFEMMESDAVKVFAEI
ncbi:NAD-dependent protein deacylase [Listeria monocytogenes]|uniref:NAD-dependent protein deacetylase n=1 Tax=Listeria monocytogenes serotype 1/2a TaxID=1906951 RepID=A0A9P1YLW4_LISMN|nr:NAD-dependent protein deacylase [Listeria monocytogenes]EAF3074200.1 NAD-dependent protein deacylase [Listeria monocytogenes serotype 1/2a]EHC6177847.1 NAD-dependent protein deacylase [Listeria monocytogenes serotype 1/2b]EAC5125538.1 NAD-dependent protein deacylase [Listeria monocytogenes]EAC5234360.1 NAD-dependent protein deacylase [Listeria monocytogenes]EAD4090740.1 NAD-dependent protein deacylase [Listeria monocytogenes]